MTARLLPASVSCLAALLLGGCSTARPAEKEAKERVSRIGRLLPPSGGRPALPPLRSDSSLAEFTRYAVLNHPAVAASYQEWRASVEAIAPARALPDPQLTFQADITGTLASFMPGLMFDFMTSGRRAAMAGEATASSQVAYRAHVSTVLKVAAEVRNGWIGLAHAAEVIRLREASLAVLGQAADIAGTDYATGRGGDTLEDPVRLATDAARARSEIAALNDRLAAARTGFKSSLGLLPTDADPAWPHPSLETTPLPPEDELWRRIQSSDPDLAQMRAMVDEALAGVEVARTAGTPGFSLGTMADLKADPLLVRPLASVTLPVWREKIAAVMASAGARRDAAVARVGAGQLDRAARMARMLDQVREADRRIAFIEGQALPGTAGALATEEAGYQSGMAGLAPIPETKLMGLEMQLERAEALNDRETAVTELLLMISDVAPAGSPLSAEDRTPNPEPP